MAARNIAYLAKGGDAGGETVEDRLVVPGRPQAVWTAPRIATRHNHGTGCTLSAAIAAGLAKGASMREAVEAGKDFISAALAEADTLRIGQGRGPVHHFHALWPKSRA